MPQTSPNPKTEPRFLRPEERSAPNLTSDSEKRGFHDGFTYVGSCQNQGPFLGALNIRCHIIIGTQKGTILTTTHVYNIVAFMMRLVFNSWIHATQEGRATWFAGRVRKELTRLRRAAASNGFASGAEGGTISNAHLRRHYGLWLRWRCWDTFFVLKLVVQCSSAYRADPSTLCLVGT